MITSEKYPVESVIEPLRDPFVVMLAATRGLPDSSRTYPLTMADPFNCEKARNGRKIKVDKISFFICSVISKKYNL